MTSTKECDIIMAKYVSPTIEITDKPAGTKGSFFVRLAYGYVEHKLGMNTAQMTTDEVIREFLGAKGTKTPKEFFDKKFKGKEEPKKEETKSVPKTDTTNNKDVDYAVNNNQRVKYNNVLTKQVLSEAYNSGGKMGELSAKLFNDDHFVITNRNDVSTSNFSPNYNTVILKNKAIEWNENSSYTKYESVYHEWWHAIDFNFGEFEATEQPQMTYNEIYYYSRHKKKYDELYGGKRLSSDYVLSTGKTFNDTLDREYKTQKKSSQLLENLKNDVLKDKQAGYTQAELDRKYGDVSDVVSGFELNGFGLSIINMGHSKKYWNDRSTKARGREAFAEVASAKATNPESYSVFKKYFPETVKAFEEIYSKLEKGEIKPNVNKKSL